MSTYRVYILLVLCVLFWSGNIVLGKFVNTQIEAFELAFFRWLFTFIFLLPTLFIIDIKKVIKIFRKNFLFLSFLSILGITLFNTILYIALETTSATNALIINSTTPLLILLFSFIILKTKITSSQIIGIFLSTFGVIFLVLKGNLFDLSDIKFSKGDFWIILSSIVWAIYSTIIKLKPKELTRLELFVTTVFIGFLFLIPLYLLQGYSIKEELLILNENWYFFAYLSLFASLLSYYFWNIGVDEIGAEKTGQFTHLMPIFGAILAFIFLGERLELFHLIGALFIAIGIFLSLFIKVKKSE